MSVTGVEIIVEYDSCGYLVDEFFVSTSHTVKATVEHGTMSNSGSETLIVALNRHVGQFFTELLQERVYIPSAFRRITIQLLWEPNDDHFYRLIRAIVFYEGHEVAGAHGGKTVGTYLENISHGYTATFASIVNC